MKQNRTVVSALVLGLVAALVAGLSVRLPQGAAHAQDPDRDTAPQGIAAPQDLPGTAFTYQGWLIDDGSPANGQYSFRFRLYEAVNGGLPLDTVIVSGMEVVDGLFTVHVDFGEVYTGTSRYLEIGVVRYPCIVCQYTVLNPRQELTPAPYALALPGLWTQQNATSPNLIGGYSGNSVAPGVVAAVIGGGGDRFFPNTVLADYGTVGGGQGNVIGEHSSSSTIGGGFDNVIGGGNEFATIAGGVDNDIYQYSNASSIGGGVSNIIAVNADYSAIGGGNSNQIGEDSTCATIPGGHYNEANADFTFAAGLRAKANNQGCFVWGDSTSADISCNNDNRTIFRSTGGFTIYTNTGLSSGVYISNGGNSWNSVSDRARKENFTPVDTQALLAHLAEIPITSWNYKSQYPAIRHVGPMAQDFNALLPGLGGEGETYINSLDADGVALAAIQGLYAQNQELAAENNALRAENATQQQQIDDLEARLTAVERNSGVASPSHSNLPSAWLLLGGLVLAGGVVLRQSRMDCRRQRRVSLGGF